MYSPRPSSAIAARERPLFPGYLFCRYVTHISYRIVQAPGVIRLVGESHAPLPVDEDEITAIQRVVRSGIYNEPWRFAEPGARVRIRVGPLCGLAGTLVTVRNLEWLIISVTLLQRAIAVSVRGADVEILEPALAASL
jgi:transcription antitermination factor NusG